MHILTTCPGTISHLQKIPSSESKGILFSEINEHSSLHKFLPAVNAYVYRYDQLQVSVSWLQVETSKKF